MRVLTILLAACLLLGCSSPVVVVIPGFSLGREPVTEHARVPDNCRYMGLVITHSLSSELSALEDVELGARIAELMRSEFRRAGAKVTDDAREAYWSLMVLAASDDRHYEGFLFSAILELRQIHEGHDPGVTAYAGRRGNRTPTVYSALGFGPGYELERTVRAFVEEADAALLPAARSLCAHEVAELDRDDHAESLVPTLRPL
jgi:hypothetical protein